jgi:hypothetical protein
MKFWKFSSFSLLLSLFISSCSPTALIYTPTPEQSKPTMEQVSPTQKPTLEATVEAGATATPTTTSMPTISPADVEAQVIALLKNNGGCRLPCFWGLTPGKTKREVAVSFLHQFMNISPGVEITIPRDDLQIGIKVYLANAAHQTGTLPEIEVITTAYHRIPQDSGYVDINNFDNSYYHEYFQYYTLPYLLNNYGEPDDIYFDFETDFVKEFHIYLDYSRLGWGAKLSMPLYIFKNVVKGCPAKAFTTLWLWTPGDTKTAKEYGFSSNTLFKSIKEIPNITLEEFYNKYKDPTNGECLEIPLSVWPD